MTATSEIWKDIPEYEGLYQVSSFGRVKSLSRRVPRWDGKLRLSPSRELKLSNSHGYRVVSLSKEGKIKKFFVHRLVAEAFINNPEKKPQIDHINTIKSDNRVENLHWVSNKENHNNELTIAQRSGENHWHYHKKFSDATIEKMADGHSKQAKPVEQYTIDGVYVAEYKSARAAGRALNIPATSIVAVCNGRRMTCHSFIWKYKDLEALADIREHGYPTYGAELAVLNNYSENPSEYLESWQHYQGVRHDAKNWAQSKPHRDE